jgi:hypothetical protein
MRRFGIWKEAVVILIGMGTCLPALRAGDADSPPAKKTASSSWFPFWSGSTEKSDTKGPAASSKPGSADMAQKLQTAPRDGGPEQRASEQATLLRRLAVCDQLRLIATQKKDERLLQQAEQLDERSWQVYLSRIEHLPASKAVGDDRALEPATEAGATEPPAGGRALSIRK